MESEIRRGGLLWRDKCIRVKFYEGYFVQGCAFLCFKDPVGSRR